MAHHRPIQDALIPDISRLLEEKYDLSALASQLKELIVPVELQLQEMRKVFLPIVEELAETNLKIARQLINSGIYETIENIVEFSRIYLSQISSDMINTQIPDQISFKLQEMMEEDTLISDEDSLPGSITVVHSVKEQKTNKMTWYELVVLILAIATFIQSQILSDSDSTLSEQQHVEIKQVMERQNEIDQERLIIEKERLDLERERLDALNEFMEFIGPFLLVDQDTAQTADKDLTIQD